MRDEKFYCDHCGEEIYCTYYDGYIDSVIETPNKLINVDLCTNCIEELNKFITNFVNYEGKK